MSALALLSDLVTSSHASRLSLPSAVAARLRSLLERQDAGKPLTAAEHAEDRTQEVRQGPFLLGLGLVTSATLALEVLEHYCAISLRKRQVREGTLFALCEGRIAAQARFKSQRYVEAEPLPAVRAPGERESCLSLLAVLAAA